MKFSRTDWAHLNWSLASLLLALSAGVTAIVAGNHLNVEAQRTQQASRLQLTAARNRLATVSQDLENRQAYTVEYSELFNKNIFGEGRRLDWIESLEKIRLQHRVLNFKYAIAPQHPYAPSIALDSGNFALSMSDMTLQFDLLHEEQLMRFFDALLTNSNGWFVLDQCVIERNTDSNATARLKAECIGGWLTLKNKMSP
jgi:hypothetical protein